MSETSFWSNSIKNKVKNIRFGIVQPYLDTDTSGTIRVRIPGIDDKKSSDGNFKVSTDQLPPCIPLLPRFLNIMPKPGEGVLVFQWDTDMASPQAEFQTTRFWMGPVISKVTNLSFDDATQSSSVFPFGPIATGDPGIQTGAYEVGSENVVLQGRYNTDIVQKDREIWLRAGKFIEGDNIEFNKQDIGYIQLKYGGEKLKRTTVDKEHITLIPPEPTTLIVATISSFVGNQLLSFDLPDENYKSSTVTKTTYHLQVKNIKSGKVIHTLIDEKVGSNNRVEALKESLNFINLHKGAKWKLKCLSADLLNKYPNAKNGIAIFSVTPTERKATIKVNKVVANDDNKTSVMNLVANKINLLSHDGEHNFDLTNPEYLITTDEQGTINSEAHPLVYGDKLVKFLELVKEYVNLHVHPYHGLPSDPDTTKLEVLRFDLDTILNHNINSN